MGDYGVSRLECDRLFQKTSTLTTGMLYSVDNYRVQTESISYQ